MTPQHRDAIVTAAETWLHTPWHHFARVRGAGVDCGQLLIAAYVGAGLVQDFTPARYAQDFMLHRHDEQFLGWVKAHLDEVETPGRGDVAVWRFGHVFSHGAIVTAWPAIIHAYRPEGAVVYGHGRQGRLAAPRPVRFFTLDRRLA